MRGIRGIFSLTKRYIRTGLFAPHVCIHSESAEGSVSVEKLATFHVTLITLNRREQRNCVDPDTANLLCEALRNFAKDDNSHAAVLHGSGGNFSAGIDLKGLQDAGNVEKWIKHGLVDLRSTFCSLNKPLVAAMSGWAVGLGLELALFCDLRLMDSSCRLGFLNRRFDLPATLDGCENLSNLIGRSRALDLVLNGRIVEAKEALAIGLVNKVVKQGTVVGEAVNMARQIAKFPQDSLRADRNRVLGRTHGEENFQDACQLLQKNASDAAEKFVELGLGRHGKFDVNAAVALERWQEELLVMKKEWEQRQTSANN